MVKIRIGLVGDLHGNTKEATDILNKMGDRKISHVFVVGDFGLWTHFADGHEFLDDLNSVAAANNLSVYAVGGNHENWDHWEWFCANMPTSKGMALVRRRVLLIPKVHNFTLSGRKFVVAGGAVSIDAEYRRARERGDVDDWSGRRTKGTGARTLWWDNEQLTDDDVRKLNHHSYANSDVLLTHDCSNYTHFQGRLKPDPESERHRRRIDNVISATKPKVHFHGHMHTKYEWENVLSHGCSAFDNDPWTGPVTKTYGLEADFSAMHHTGVYDHDNWGVLETDDLSFAFQGEGMQFRSLD